MREKEKRQSLRIVDNNAARTTTPLLAAADRVSQVSHRAAPISRNSLPPSLSPSHPHPGLSILRLCPAFIGSIAGTKARDDDSSALRLAAGSARRALPDVPTCRRGTRGGGQASIEGARMRLLAATTFRGQRRAIPEAEGDVPPRDEEGRDEEERKEERKDLPPPAPPRPVVVSSLSFPGVVFLISTRRGESLCGGEERASWNALAHEI